MNPCKDYDCHCHLPSYLLQSSPSSVTWGSCCPMCRIEGAPPKVTASNLWKIVSAIEQHDDPYYAAVRFYLRFREPVTALPLQQQFSVVVSKQYLEFSGLSVRAILAQHLNEYFAGAGQQWPPHLVGYLSMDDNALPSSWQTMAWKGGPAQQQVVSGHKVMRDLETHIPGIRAYVPCPACPIQHVAQIITMVQHLNDNCGYTREQVADWLEALDVDLSFPAEPPAPKELPRAKRDELLVIIGPTQASCEHEARRRGRQKKDVVMVSSGQGHHRIIERLRGRRGFQYTVLPGAYIADEVEQFLAYSDVTEVGDEEPRGPGVYVEEYLGDSSAKSQAIKALYQQQLAYQLQPIQFYDPLGGQPVTIKFTKADPGPKMSGKSYHLAIWDEAHDQGHEGSSVGYSAVYDYVKNLYIQHSSWGKALSHAEFLYGKAQVLDPWPGEPLEDQAKALMKNLAALKGSEHENDVLWLADPTILGEHLPAVKEPKPKVQGGHALTFGGDSWTKFTKPDWKK